MSSHPQPPHDPQVLQALTPLRVPNTCLVNACPEGVTARPPSAVSRSEAGKPRPTSTYGDPYPGATVHEDGSWEYKSESHTMTTKADGTWEWTNSKGDKANLNADGTWESFDAQRNERVHVNPDGSWIRVRESGDTDLTKGAKGMEVKADGTWRSVDSYSTLYGTADGKVYQEKPGQEKREVGKELTPSTVPVTPIAYAEGGVGGNSVVPLKPRTPLKPGEKAQ